MTVDGEDLRLLELLSVVKRTPAGSVLSDLIRTEYDREQPGKRHRVPGSGIDRLREALGLPDLGLDDEEARHKFLAKLEEATTEAHRVYQRKLQQQAESA